MHAPNFISRILPVAAVTAGLLLAAPAAEAAPEKKVTATIALGDKRVEHGNIKPSAAVKPKAKTKKKKSKKAKKSSAPVSCQNTDVMPAADNLDAVRAAILCLHNKLRGGKGLPLLKENARLRKAALGHSAAMVGEGYFDHTSPDGGTFVDRIIGARYAKRNDGWTLGENLAWGTGDLSTAAGVMDAWMNSSGHKANILKRDYREIGIGIRLGVPSDETVGATITADFGTRY